MGPKKKGKGKKAKGKKRKPDPGWAKTVRWGTWSRPYESMPSSALSPKFGVIRIEFLAAVKEVWQILLHIFATVSYVYKSKYKHRTLLQAAVSLIPKCLQLDMIWSKTLAEDFLKELFSIPRPNLEFFCIRGAYLLKRFVLSPYEILTGLKRLDIGCMDALEFVLIQCTSLEWLSLSRSKSLTKALIEARNLQSLVIDNCLELSSLMVWSQQLTTLTGLYDSKKLQVLFLDCPTLVNYERPVLYVSWSTFTHHYLKILWLGSSWTETLNPVMVACLTIEDWTLQHSLLRLSQFWMMHTMNRLLEWMQVVPKPKVLHPSLLQLRKWEDKQADKPELEFGLLPKDLVVDDDALSDDTLYPNVPCFPRTHLQGF